MIPIASRIFNVVENRQLKPFFFLLVNCQTGGRVRDAVLVSIRHHTNQGRGDRGRARLGGTGGHHALRRLSRSRHSSADQHAHRYDEQLVPRNSGTAF